MNKSHFSILIILVLLLISLGPLLPAQADSPPPSPDIDGDGLSNELETGGWYNLTGGPFFTDPYNADSDSDGLTDGEEKLFDTDPLNVADPGIYVRYEDQFKTRQYFSPQNDMEKDEWGNWIRKYLPVRQGGDRLLMTEAMVVRRGTTFHIGGPLTATLSISSNGLTSINPARDECQNTWSVTVPANAKTGTYTATLGSKSMPIYVIFELPTDLTQAQIDAYIYDDDPLNKRDEVSVWWRTPEWSYYFPGYSETTPPNCDNYPNSACSNWKYGLAAGYAQAFWTEQFTQKVFVKHAMVAIQGQSNRTTAANKIIERADQEFRTVYVNTHNTWSTAMRKFHDGTDWTMDGGACQDNANVLTSLLRSAGLPAKPFLVDWNKTPDHGETGQIGNSYEYDHAVLLWLDGAWKRARSYNGQELSDVYYPYYNGRVYVTSSLFNVYGDQPGDLIVTSDHRWDWQNGSNGGGMVNTVWLTGGQREGVPTEEFASGNLNWDYRWWSHRPLQIQRSPYAIILNYEVWHGDNWAPSEWHNDPPTVITYSNPPGRSVRQSYTLPAGIPDPENPLENWPYNPVPVSCSPSSEGTPDCLDMLAGGGLLRANSMVDENVPADKGLYQVFLPLVMSGGRTAQTTPVKLGRILGSYGQDTDGNGHFDRLIVEVEVNAAQDGQYEFGGTLLVGDQPIPTQSGPVTVRRFDPSSGAQVVQLAFDGQTIGTTQVDGSYSLVELWAANPGQPIEKVIDPTTVLDHHYLNYKTPAFRADQFETIAALFGDRFSHQWQDTDGNGRYDALDIQVGININYPGVYTVTGELDDGEGRLLGMATWSGTDAIATLRFDVAKSVAPYTLGRLYLYDARGRILSSRYYQAYQVYEAPAFLEQNVSLVRPQPAVAGPYALAVVPSQVFTTTTTDADGDGRYDALVIQAGVFVTGTTGTYRIEGLLVDEQGIPVAWSVSDPKPLALGDQTLELTFDGKALYDYLSFGPPTRSFKLIAVRIFSGNLSPATLEAQVDVALTTSPYQRNDFEPSGTDLLVDDMENGTSNWVWTAPWSLSELSAKSPTHAWRAQTTNTDGSLRTLSLDTRNYVHPALRFQTCYNMANANKRGYVEVSLNNGVTWNRMMTVTNASRPWAFQYLNLDAYGEQENLQIRFNASASGGGQLLWYVDNVYLIAWPAITGASFTYPAGPLSGCTPISFTATYTSVDTTLPITYTWDWGDGTSTVTTDPSVYHEFPDLGQYTVMLTVENPYDDKTVTQTVEIDIPCGPYFTSAPVITATEDQPYVYNITVDAMASGPLTVTAPTIPAWLTLVDHGNRTATLSGLPGNDQVGPHAVVLQAEDTLGLIGTQRFTLTVENVNDPPNLDDAAFGMDENSPNGMLVGTVTATDIDPDETLTYSILSGNTGTAFAIGAANGEITVNNSAMLDYETSPQFVLTVQVSDSGGLTDTATITISLNDVNDAPVLNPIGDRTVDEGTLLTFTAAATDADVPANALTFSLGAGAPAGASINPTGGEFTWTPTEAQGPGVYTVTIIVTDNGMPNLSDSETITITVNEVNAAPVVNPIEDKTVDEGTLLSLTATATDADVPANALTFSLGAGAPAGASINPTSGAFTWTPTEAQGPGVYTITVMVTDNGTPNLNGSTSFRVTVNEVNTAPVLNPIDDKTVDEGILLTFTAAATDADVPANALTFSLGAGAPAGASINPTSGVFTWTPTEAQGPGVYTITVMVNDHGTPNLSDSTSFRVTVNEANIAPVLNPIGDRTVDEGTLLTFTAIATDGDEPPDALTFSLGAGAPAGASINPTGGEFTWTPTEAQGPGVYTVTIIVTDNGTPNLSDSETITIIVNEVNTAPAVSPIEDKTVDEGTLLSLTATATDADVPANVLTFSLGAGAPAGASINPTSGAFTWTPTEAQGPGVYTITVMVTDNGTPNLSASTSFRVTVNEVNTAPVLNPIGDRTVDEGTLLSLTAAATDADVPANALTFSLGAGAPAGASINPTGGEFTWTPTEAQGPGVYTVTIIVTDNGTPNLSDSETITITVNEVNAAPIANHDWYAVNEAGTLNVAAPGVLSNDTDSEGSPLTATLISDVAHGVLVFDSSGAFTYTHDGSETTVDSFTYRASDGELESNVATVTIVINPINDPPVATDDSYTTLEGGLLRVNVPGMLGNDYDPEGGTLTVNLIQQATHGVVTLLADGAFTYQHDGSETTADEFEYQVCDDGMPTLCDTARVVITILPVNDPPVARSDEYTLDEGTTLNVPAPGVLGNDTDAEGDPLQAALVTGPMHGVLILNTDGSFTYTHDGSETLIDRFTYRAGDGLLLSNVTTVTLNINPINDPPVANDDRVVTPENTPVEIDVLANDSDSEGDILTIIAVSSPANGIVTHDGTRVTYTPNSGFAGEDTFTYTVSDGNGGIAQATVTVVVDDSLATLTVQIVGQGSVESDPAQVWYIRGSDVRLTAHPEPGWAFNGWSGDLAGTDNPATLNMAANRLVTATFVYTGFHPQINVQISAPEDAAVGETVTYTIALGHAPGSDGWPVDNVQVNSSIGGPASYVGGDTDGDGELDADETWIWIVEYTVQESDPNPLLNTITASVRDLEQDTEQFESTHSLPIVTRAPTRFTVYLPLVTRGFVATPAATDGPDLVVQQIRATPNSIEVVIKNQGNRPVVDSFWIDLYINPTVAPTHVNQAWNDLSTQGMVWGMMPVTGMLDPGQTVTLRSGGAYYWASKSQVTWPLPVGATIYVQVDSYNLSTSYGGVLENHEIDGKPYNNILRTTVSTVASEAESPSLDEAGVMSEGDLPLR